MQVENVYIKCAIESLKRLVEQRSLSAKICTRNELFFLRNYVLALCHKWHLQARLTSSNRKLFYQGSIKSTKSQKYTG